jgi:hypothetical protein
MNSELERISKEMVMAKFKVLFWHLPGRTEENHKKPVRLAGLWVEI